MGILSKGLILLPQLGHWEGGDMIDNFLGRRYIHTFEKLPIAAPNRNIKIGIRISIYDLNLCSGILIFEIASPSARNDRESKKCHCEERKRRSNLI